MGKTIQISVDVQERGRNGGFARAANQTAAQLSEQGKKAARARWQGHKAKRRKKAGPQ